MSKISSDKPDIITLQTPEDRSNYTASGNPSDPIALFNVKDSVWLSIPRKGDFEFIIIARKQEKGRFVYQIKNPKSEALYKEGEWFKQERLSPTMGPDFDCTQSGQSVSVTNIGHVPVARDQTS